MPLEEYMVDQDNSDISPSVNNSSLIEHVTMASTGDGSTFGDLITGRGAMGTCSSPTRGIFAGGGQRTPSGCYSNY